MTVKYCIACGIDSIGNMKPDSSMFGTSTNCAVSAACCWVPTSVAIRMPNPSTTMMNRLENATSVTRLPATGTLPERSRRKNHGAVGQPDHDVGNRFADQHFRGSDRRHRQLFDGSALTLAHQAECGQRHHQFHQEYADDSRNHVVDRAQGGVEPHAGLLADSGLHDVNPFLSEILLQACVVLDGNHSVGVAQRNGCRV